MILSKDITNFVKSHPIRLLVILTSSVLLIIINSNERDLLFKLLVLMQVFFLPVIFFDFIFNLPRLKMLGSQFYLLFLFVVLMFVIESSYMTFYEIIKYVGTGAILTGMLILLFLLPKLIKS
jgi:hypothetical protein